MEQVREITERYHFGPTLSVGRRVRTVEATDRETGAPVVFELASIAGGSGGRGSEPAGAYRAACLAAAGRLADLEHPGLPQLVDFGVTSGGDLFLVRAGDEGLGFVAAAGEAAPRVVGLLLQAIDTLEALAGAGVPHGALSLDTLRLIQTADGWRCRVVGLAEGVLLAAGDPARRDLAAHEDLRALARIAAGLLGAAIEEPESPSPAVTFPLAVSFELDDAEAARRVLERCLRADPAAQPAGWGEVRRELRRASGGTVAGAPGSIQGPPVRLTYSTKPPDDGLVFDDAAEPAADATAEAAGAETEDTAVFTGNDTAAALPEDTAVFALEDTAVRGPDDTAVPAPRSASEVSPPTAEEVLPPLPDLDDLIEPPPPMIPAAAAPAAIGTAPPAPPPPHAPVAAPAQPPAGQPGDAAIRSPAPATATPAGARRWPPRIALAAGAGLVLAALAVVAVVALWPRRDEAPASRAAAEPQTGSASAADRPPAEPLDPRLVRAREQLAGGDDRAAAASLAALGPEDEAGFGPAGCDTLALVRRTLRGAQWQRAAEELGRAMAAGDMAGLRRALEAVGPASAAAAFVEVYPELRGPLRQAQRYETLDQRARQALAAGEAAQAIEYAGVLREVFPSYADIREVREEAAQTIERRAEELAAAGRLQEALDELSPLDRVWSDRAGLADRIALYRSRLRQRRDFESLLAAALDAGERGRPDEGLALLAGVTPGEQLETAFASARSALQRRLAELDGSPPQIVLAPGTAPEIVKNETARLTARVTDDYKVVRVEVWVRPVDGTYRKLIHDRSGAEVTAEITPEIHGNKSVEYYILAGDLSGHETALGSPDRPLQIERRRWYHRFRND